MVVNNYNFQHTDFKTEIIYIYDLSVWMKMSFAQIVNYLEIGLFRFVLYYLCNQLYVNSLTSISTMISEDSSIKLFDSILM